MNISGKLEPIQFSVVAEGDKNVVTLLALKSGHTYRKEFEPGLSIKEMLADVKADLFST